MDRSAFGAAKVLRRSGVKLLSLSGGHSDLNVLISELRDIKKTAKLFSASQNSAAEYLARWSYHEENIAIKDVSARILELNQLWTDAQTQFIDEIKAFKYCFEMILEDEKRLDHAKNNVSSLEHKAGKTRSQIKKAEQKHNQTLVRKLKTDLSDLQGQLEFANEKAAEMINETESVKLIRFKQGLMKLSQAYVDLAHKCEVIFESQTDVVLQLPDIDDRRIQDIRYTGTASTQHSVGQAKNFLKHYKRRTRSCHAQLGVSNSNTVPNEPPPPYNPDDYHSTSIHDFRNHSMSSLHSLGHHDAATGGTGYHPPRYASDASLSTTSRASLGSIGHVSPTSGNQEDDLMNKNVFEYMGKLDSSGTTEEFTPPNQQHNHSGQQRRSNDHYNSAHRSSCHSMDHFNPNHRYSAHSMDHFVPSSHRYSSRSMDHFSPTHNHSSSYVTDQYHPSYHSNHSVDQYRPAYNHSVSQFTATSSSTQNGDISGNNYEKTACGPRHLDNCDTGEIPPKCGEPLQNAVTSSSQLVMDKRSASQPKEVVKNPSCPRKEQQSFALSRRDEESCLQQRQDEQQGKQPELLPPIQYPDLNELVQDVHDIRNNTAASSTDEATPVTPVAPIPVSNAPSNTVNSESSIDSSQVGNTSCASQPNSMRPKLESREDYIFHYVRNRREHGRRSDADASVAQFINNSENPNVSTISYRADHSQTKASSVKSSAVDGSENIRSPSVSDKKRAQAIAKSMHSRDSYFVNDPILAEPEDDDLDLDYIDNVSDDGETLNNDALNTGFANISVNESKVAQRSNYAGSNKHSVHGRNKKQAHSTRKGASVDHAKQGANRAIQNDIQDYKKQKGSPRKSSSLQDERYHKSTTSHGSHKRTSSYEAATDGLAYRKEARPSHKKYNTSDTTLRYDTSVSRRHGEDRRHSAPMTEGILSHHNVTRQKTDDNDDNERGVFV